MIIFELFFYTMSLILIINETRCTVWYLKIFPHTSTKLLFIHAGQITLLSPSIWKTILFSVWAPTTKPLQTTLFFQVSSFSILRNKYQSCVENECSYFPVVYCIIEVAAVIISHIPLWTFQSSSRAVLWLLEHPGFILRSGSVCWQLSSPSLLILSCRHANSVASPHRCKSSFPNWNSKPWRNFKIFSRTYFLISSKSTVYVNIHNTLGIAAH